VFDAAFPLRAERLAFRPAIAAAIVVKPFFVFEPVLRFTQTEEHYNRSDEQHESQKHQRDDQESVHAAGVTAPTLTSRITGRCRSASSRLCAANAAPRNPR
jgi:hypothetical protein